MRERTRCPACEEATLRPIIYGLVVGNLVEKARRGEVVLGGCSVGEDSSKWECPVCGEQFQEAQVNET